jgi:hypothetical protein
MSCNHGYPREGESVVLKAAKECPWCLLEEQMKLIDELKKENEQLRYCVDNDEQWPPNIIRKEN